jgi:hypothetical protein
MTTTTNYYEETRADGSVIRQPGTRWKALGPVTLDLTPSAEWNVEKQRFTNLEGDPAKENVHVRPWIIELRAGDEVVLPSEIDNAIEQRACREPGCRLGMRCRNWGHAALVVGGLSGGRLERIGGTASPARLHPSLVCSSAPMPLASGGTGDADADTRLLARARAMRDGQGGT